MGIHILFIFTLLRVGLPPTQQVFFLSVTGAKGGVEHEDRVCWPPASPCKLAGERQ